MIESISDYFKGIVNEIDSDLKYDGLVFDNTLTADHNLDFTYKMVIGRMAIKRQDSDNIAKFPVSLKIYKVSNIDKLEDDFKNTYCKAIDISSLAMNQTRISQSDYIKSVEGLNIAPNPLLDNDNTLQFTLEFSVTCVYKYVI